MHVDSPRVALASPLTRVFAGHLGAAEALVRRGADVDARHGHGGSALVEAATAGATNVLALLVAEGADPRVVDDDGVTALMQGHPAP